MPRDGPRRVQLAPQEILEAAARMASQGTGRARCGNADDARAEEHDRGPRRACPAMERAPRRGWVSIPQRSSPGPMRARPHDLGNVAGFGQRRATCSVAGANWRRPLRSGLACAQDDPLLPARHGQGGRPRRSPRPMPSPRRSAISGNARRPSAAPRSPSPRLGFGLPTAVAADRAPRRPVAAPGPLLKGKGADRDLVTTRDAIGLEQRIVAAVETGRGAARRDRRGRYRGRAAAGTCAAQVRHDAQCRAGRSRASAALARTTASSPSRAIAGAGKSTVLRPVAEVLREEGRSRARPRRPEHAGPDARARHRHPLDDRRALPAPVPASCSKAPTPSRLAEARAAMRGAVVLLDEASMVGNADKEKLVRLANLLELGRFASIGDRKQLGAVDAGKPFDVMQQAGRRDRGDGHQCSRARRVAARCPARRAGRPHRGGACGISAAT